MKDDSLVCIHRTCSEYKNIKIPAARYCNVCEWDLGPLSIA